MGNHGIFKYNSIMDSKSYIELTERYSTKNYAPLDVVLTRGQGAWCWDVDGKKYLDMLAAYSAMNFGHSNPRFVNVAKAQLDNLTLTSRAFYTDKLALFCRDIAELAKKELVVTMNSGAEAAETAIKAARRWGYERKHVEADRAEIICFENNFAGRTITLISFSTSKGAKAGYGPLTPGFQIAKYGDIDSVKGLINKNTVAVMVEPIQGEAGVLIPPVGFLPDLRALCDAENLLLIADEIQTGLCRTGEIFCCDHEKVVPDLILLGKSLGAGIIPISVVLGNEDVLGVFTPGTHGSTFGGNALAAAIGSEVIAYIKEEKPHLHAKELGEYFVTELRKIKSNKVREVRGRGLMIGVDIAPEAGVAKKYCKELKALGVLCKDTREQTIRFTPPLVISREEIDYGLSQIRQVLG